MPAVMARQRSIASPRTSLGVGLTLYALVRLLVPGKARLTLSPAGLRLPIEWVKDVVIPGTR